ncbi:hypothetical protein [Antarctobacter jejuensis]|uniref:hypothetical protein n=1 Tax=Antarctobacter jejuensis TaxID=1439938 RepID=UPI003FD29AEA
MTSQILPRHSADLLSIPQENVPGVIHSLLDARALSGLVQEIHREMRSPDPKLRQQAALALRHMGFPD